MTWRPLSAHNGTRWMWEADEEPWEPGTPLQPHPSGIAQGGQVVRSLYELQADYTLMVLSDLRGLVGCRRCEVMWAGVLEPCWMCGVYGVLGVPIEVH